MTYQERHPGLRCKAHKTNGSGDQCKAYAIHGSTVCGAHGGRAPQTKTRARERMEAMVDPALNKLRRLIDMADSDSVSLSAIKDILDRTGYKLPERIESDSSVVIRVEYEPLEREPVKIIEHHYEQLQNGASNGQSENGSRHHD